MSKIGCTFLRGRVAGETVETDTVREAGQFAEYLSCGIRGTATLAIPRGSKVGAARGGLIIYFDPDLASNAGGLGGFGRVFQIGTLGPDWIGGYYDKGNARLALNRGGSGAAVAAHTFTAGSPQAWYFAWDETTLYVAANGGTIGTLADSSTGIAIADDIYIGTDNLGFNEFEMGAGGVVFLDGPISQGAWEVLAGLRAERPPAYGEGGLGASMTGLWYGAQPVVWSLAANGQCIDLNDIRGGEVFLEGWPSGVSLGPSLHRMIDTPLRDGSIYVDTKGQRRIVSVPLLVHTRGTIDHLWELRRAIAAALNPRQGEGVLTFASGRHVYEIDAILTNAGLELIQNDPISARGLPVQFICAGADWRDSVRTSAEGEVPASGWYIPWEIPWELSESAVDLAIENDGDVPVYPTVVITAGDAGCTAPSIENTTTGKRFGMRASFAMDPGTVLTVDMDARTALLDGTNVMGSRDPDMQMWALEPGENELTAAVAEGSATVEVRYVPRLVGV